MSRKIRFVLTLVLSLFLCWIVSSQAIAQEKDKININEASVEKLQELDGVGDVLANKIVEYRKGNDFETKEEIKEIDGIGKERCEEIKEDIVVKKE